MAASRKINLIPKDGFEYTAAGRVLTWMLSAGRVIVIFTELVVIIAFLSRFVLDRQRTDLNGQNAAKRKQIETTSAFEKNFRAVQGQLSEYKEIIDSQKSPSQIIKKIASLLPSNVSLSKISFSGDGQEIILQGTALSEGGLSGFVKNLSFDKEFSSINLDKVALDEQNNQALVFDIKGKVIFEKGK